ncbi:hypothetical protein N9K45_00165 [bacterium]|nr:hypothetical protein [bacterium]
MRISFTGLNLSRYTVFQLSGEVEGIGGVRPEPVVSERRFAEVADFHSVWCEPMMSPDRPVFLPPKEPVSFVMKNDAELVAGRVVAIRALSSFSRLLRFVAA